jgi:hypothetical protein
LLDEEELDEEEVDVDEESERAAAGFLIALLATDSRALTVDALLALEYRGIIGRESYTPCILLRVLLFTKRTKNSSIMAWMQRRRRRQRRRNRRGY